MAFARTQTFSVNTEFNGSGGTTTVVVLGVAVAIGDCLLLGTTVGADPTTLLASTVTDQLGNSYTRVLAANGGQRYLSSDGQGYDTWSSIVTVAGTPTITYTPNTVVGAPWLSIKGSHFTGTNAASVVRATNGTTQVHPGTGADAIATPSVAAVSGDLQWGFAGVQGPNATMAGGTGYTPSAIDATTGMLDEWKTASGAGAATFTDGTNGGGSNYATMSIAVTPAGAGGSAGPSEDYWLPMPTAIHVPSLMFFG